LQHQARRPALIDGIKQVADLFRRIRCPFGHGDPHDGLGSAFRLVRSLASGPAAARRGGGGKYINVGRRIITARPDPGRTTRSGAAKASASAASRNSTAVARSLFFFRVNHATPRFLLMRPAAVVRLRGFLESQRPRLHLFDQGAWVMSAPRSRSARPVVTLTTTSLGFPAIAHLTSQPPYNCPGSPESPPRTRAASCK
jgi:hypothetical protein